MKTYNKKRGFTIIKLVVVVAVIAILSAVLIPTFAGIIKKAKQSSDEQAVRGMNTALIQTADMEDIDIFDVSAVLSENGFNTEAGLVPSLKGYAYYWCKPANTVVYVKTEGGAFELIYPKKVEGFSRENCQPLGAKIPTAISAPVVSADNSKVSEEKTTVAIPSTVTDFASLVEWTNATNFNDNKMWTEVNGVKKEGVAFSGNVKLTENITLGEKGNAGRSMAYNIVADTTIDLNGYTITQANAGTGQSLALFAVRAGATLNIIDSSAQKGGAIAVGICAFQIDANATVNLYAGTIKVAADRSTADVNYGSSLVWANGGTFNMFGGAIDTTGDNVDPWALINNETATVNLFYGSIKGAVETTGTVNVYEVTIA
ncbi:MAG: hypothetical protein IKB20_01525 [Clostridia bacterium]|nr:hypothetical protein [Clostridia bacterium]